LNDLRHGSGTLYYKNGNIRYEGDFAKGKFEGSGKKIYKNGDYYIGRWADDRKNGNGILYDKNGVVKVQGNFKNDRIDLFK
jgi:hypothetical protein